jgi:hypothetical protein
MAWLSRVLLIVMIQAPVPGVRGARPVEPGSLPSDLTALMTKASLDVRVFSWCRATNGFAIATVGTDRRYVVLHGDGRAETLAAYMAGPDLACYSRREAERLDASIKQSDTIDGSVTPRWDTTVICGFIADTEAVCWQYSPGEKKFVRIGGWTT